MTLQEIMPAEEMPKNSTDTTEKSKQLLQEQQILIQRLSSQNSGLRKELQHKSDEIVRLNEQIAMMKESDLFVSRSEEIRSELQRKESELTERENSIEARNSNVKRRDTILRKSREDLNREREHLESERALFLERVNEAAESMAYRRIKENSYWMRVACLIALMCLSGLWFQVGALSVTIFVVLTLILAVWKRPVHVQDDSA